MFTDFYYHKHSYICILLHMYKDLFRCLGGKLPSYQERKCSILEYKDELFSKAVILV